MTTYVLVHGAWGGGWKYARVADALRKRGHTVFTPTLTGQGERSHLLSGDINLTTHVTDILNVIRYEDPLGATHTFALSDATPRDAHLFAAPLEIGSWFELIKTPGSTWFPDSPSIRISVLNSAGLRLGLQGFLAGSTNPNDDSLSVWAEWLDAPAIVTAGTNLNVGFQILAAPVPEPATYVMMLLGLAAVCFGTARNRHRA